MIIKTDKAEFQSYLTDSSNLIGDANILYIPENSNELQELIKELYSNNESFTISAAGTGLTGGRVPFGGSVISIERLNQIIEFDKEYKTITIQPALTLYELEDFLEPHNLFYPPNPTERNSSIGGNISNNSSGARTFKYGFSRNYVESLTIILPDGDLLKITRRDKTINNKINLVTESGKKFAFHFKDIKMPEIKHSAGYYLKDGMDAIDLFIGSEGTLGIIIEIKLSLLETPENLLGLIVFFDDNKKMLEFVSHIRSISLNSFSKDYKEIDSISSRLIEYFDDNSLNILRPKYPQVPENAIGAIWLEQEYILEFEDKIISEWLELINNYTSLADCTWTAMNSKEHERLKEFRHSLPTLIFEITVAENHHKIATDTAVPDERFNEMYYFYKSELEKFGIKNFVFGHIGNCHIHVNLFPKSDEFDKANELYLNCINKTLELGGTVSAEHGIGKIKKKYLKMMFHDSGINEMKHIKKIFDHKNLLNQGNLF